jgi:hypothetical protein
MNSAKQMLDDILKLPDCKHSFCSPSNSRLSSFIRKSLYGTPKGKRYYLNLKRPLFRDAVIIVDVPLTWTDSKVFDIISDKYKGYIVRLESDKWEYIWHWDDYEIQKYGIYNYLESNRNSNKKISLDSYYRYLPKSEKGKPSLLFGWVSKLRKKGVDKNPLGLVIGKSIITSETSHFLVTGFTDGSKTVELKLLNPTRPGQTISHTIPMQSLIKNQ